MTAQNLIATVSAACATGLEGSIQLLSTNLSTDLCGYRRFHYTPPRFGGKAGVLMRRGNLPRRAGLA
jgi:hypothetical protein